MNKKKIIVESGLQTYFYDQLLDLNKFSDPKLSNELIHYMSMVMDRYTLSENYFEEREGRLTDKWLGKKLLTSDTLTPSERKRSLKDIGDTVLFLCGYFSPSLNRKIVNHSYYIDLGKIAYERLNSIVPLVYEIQSFYSIIASRLLVMTNMLTVLASNREELPSTYIINRVKAS